MFYELKKTKVLILAVFFFFSCADQKGNQEDHKSVTAPYVPQDAPHVIYNSINGGTAWKPFDNGIPHDATVSSFLVTDDTIFASTDSHGIYSIREGQTEWRRTDLDLPQDVDINAISTIGNSLVIGTFRHGIRVSKNNGRNWGSPSVQINNTPIRCLHAKGDILFAGADNGIYKSLDNGNTWEQVLKSVQVNGLTEVHSKIYAAAMNGAMVTYDEGVTWKYIYEPHTLHDISSDGDEIYALTLGDGLKKSANDGITWENVNAGLGTPNLYTFELKRFNNRIFAAQWYGIYTSDDRGRSWSLIKNGLPDSTAFMTLEPMRNGLIAGIGLRKK